MTARRVSYMLLVCVVLGLHSVASAQMCHMPAGRFAQDSGYRLALGSTFGAYDNAQGQGEYQGLGLSAGFDHEWLSAQASMPMYRLHDDGRTYHGFGDLDLDLRASAYRSNDGVLAVGPDFALMLPTGAENKSLGMGHVMLMPGAFFSLTTPRWSLLGQLAYGRALMDMAAHQHMAGPIVDPMNGSEIQHAIGLHYQLLEHSDATLRLSGALPAWSTAGEAREMLGVGLRGDAGMFDTAFEVQVPLMGSAFRARLLLSVGMHG